MSAPSPARGPEGPGDRLSRIRRRFGEFATEYADLPLYAALCRNLSEDDEAASLLLAARPGQARPVLWLAAVHDLVLRNPDSTAAQWYPSVVRRRAPLEGDPWPDVRQFALAHRAELEACIATHGTQTNEVNRSVYVALGLALAAADVPDLPVALLELGASAGLLLGVERYAVELTAPAGREGEAPVRLGDPGSPVRCSGVDRRGVARRLGEHGVGLPRVAARVGLDLAPVDVADDGAVRWLEACLWPDVPGRVERFRAARAVLRDDPPVLVAGDMVDDLPAALARAADGAGPDGHVVVLTSWALTYLDPARRADVLDHLGGLAARGRALSWLSAEPPGCVPGLVTTVEGVAGVEGNTVLGLHRWRDGRALEPVVLGTCQAHGAWVDVSPDLVESTVLHQSSR
ncbi:DUF2332 domain-containing protein [Terrabacter sp. NPDC000476]|uniref:DUF2332 domain-containing protein n=1 Tax=Terrabacter sp. NPDC000476 TaxID=3154258 RepID=UPI00331BC669